MTKWELEIYLSPHIDVSVNEYLYSLWEERDTKTGKRVGEDLQYMAAEGWELVSVTPITNNNGATIRLLYTFKRPVEEGK